MIPQRGVASHSWFYVGGQYKPCGGDQVMAGQMYVEAFVPDDIRHPYPLVLVHGNAQTGICFLQTLEGKPGWVYDFLAQGYVVFVVDQAERGRSVCHTDHERIVWPAAATAQLFSAPDGYPLAERHTQWPGRGVVGDEIFDQFYATQVDSLRSAAEGQRTLREAGAALLQKIGPAIVLCHSQSGPMAWIWADDHPELVKAAIAIEPSGPPFASAQTGAALLDAEGRPTTYGIAQVPLHFDPPAEHPSALRIARRESDRPDRSSGFLQAEPARQLPALAHVPMLVLSAEASYHTPFDYLTAEFLQQAGVPAEYRVLSEWGIHGNGHMMMLERNSDEIARALGGWLQENLGV